MWRAWSVRLGKAYEQLELDRPARLLLCDRSSRPHPAAADKLTDPDLHDVAAAQLAVDGEVEERAVAEASFPVEPEPYGPDLLRLERALCADHASGVPRPPLQDCRVELRMSHHVFLLAGMAVERVRCSPPARGPLVAAG
jgi:hypothetical protein